MTAPTAHAPIGLRPELSFLLTQFEARVPGALRTVAVSGDGLLLCAGPSVDSEAQADTLAAICAGMTALVIGLAKWSEPEVRRGLTGDVLGQGSGVMGLMWMSQTKSKASSVLPLNQTWFS